MSINHDEGIMWTERQSTTEKVEKSLHFNRLASTCFSPAAFKAIERVERNDGFVFLLE